MAWPISPTTGVDLQSSAFLMQFWEALQERSRALGERFWPPHNLYYLDGDPFPDGTVTSATATTIVDSSANWPADPARWTSNDGVPWNPTQYDVIIQLGNDFEWEKHVRFQITNNDATTLYVNASDWIERRIISDYSDLNGKPYYIIKRGGYWWNDRWPEPPNATILNFGIVGTSTTTTITDVEASKFPPGSLVGSDVIWFAGGLLNRSTVTSNAVPVAQVWKGTIGTTTHGHTYILTLTDPDGATVPIGITVANPPDTTTALIAAKLINAWNASSDPRIAAITATQDGAQVILTADEPGYGFVVAASGTGTWSGTGNTTANVPSFTFSPAAANRPNDGRDYLIIPEDGKWYSGFTVSASTTQPSGYDVNTGNWNFKWGCWYRGMMRAFYSNSPSNTLGGASVPEVTFTWSRGTPPLCSSSPSFDAMDNDMHSAVEEECSEADKFFAPDLFKTFRQIQLQIIAFSHNFVEPKSYDGEKEIDEMEPARLFNVASVNGFTSTVDSATSTQIVLTSATSYGAENYPLRVYFAIIREDGTTRGQPGEGSLGDTDVLVPDGGVDDWDNPDDPIDGCTVILSPGFTRYFPRRVRYMYPKTCFVPEPNASMDYQDPPTATDPGSWTTRAASTAYAEYDADRESNRVGFLTESAHAFVSNDLVRYVGENFGDPTTDTTDADLAFYKLNFFEGRSRPSVQVQIDAARRGSVTASALHWIEDSTKSWWSIPPFGLGTLITESGTATGGSSTQLSDSTKTGNGFWTEPTWFIGFVLKITKAVGGAVHYVPITSKSGTTLTFGAVAGLTVAAGDTYEIAAPRYELNRWKGRTVRFYLEDGPLDVAITHSDDTRLYFAAMATPIPTDATDYEILEKQPGTTWRWNGSIFEQPTGTDSRAGIAFPEDQSAIPPTKVKRYGPMMKGDYISHTEFFAEMYRCINKLVWTKGAAAWTSRANPTVEEKNHRYSNYLDLVPAGGVGATWPAAKADAADKYDDTAALSEANGAPPAAGSTGGLFDDYEGVVFADYERTFAYAVVSGVPTFLNHDVVVFTYGWINYLNSPPVSTADSILAFDSNGDEVAYHVWKEFESSGAISAATWQSGVFGSLALPADASEPPPLGTPPPPFFTGSGKGYYVGDECCIIKWNVSGGLTYVS